MSIHHSQRRHLIRSTRKIGAILGTTPFLLDSPPSEKALRRQGQIYSPSPSPAASLTSLASYPAPAGPLRKKSKRSPPAPLLLSLTTIPIPPTDPRAPLPPSPRAPTLRISFLRTLDRPASLPTTPLTPTFVTNVPAARRRKLARVRRTLGENVPPELVFPAPEPGPDPALPPLQPCRRSSTDALPSFLSFSPAPTPGAPSPLPSPRPSSAYIVPSPCTARPPPSATFLFVRSGVCAPEHEGLGAAPLVPAGGEWTGGWNRRDLKDVQRGLRALKTR